MGPKRTSTVAWTKNLKFRVGGSLMVVNDVSIPRESFAKIYHIKESFVMSPTVGPYTWIVQMCVKSRVGYLHREAGTIENKFCLKKTELILRPVFALISQALQNTEYIAIVMYIALFVYWRLDKDSWMRIDDSGFRKRGFNNSLMTRQLILSTRGSQKLHNTIGTPPFTFRQLWHNVFVTM